jgi:TPP-dependent pyruvate/acetoin dehydrogenase alpha subunit
MKDKMTNELIRIRLSQVLVNEEYKAGKFKIPVHLSFGHEAIAVAVSNTLETHDKLLLSHRNMAYNLARSGKLRPVMDEYQLNVGGLAKARLGSMNLNNPEKNIIYSSSILGNNFPVAAGIAMAAKLKNDRSVTFVLGGDGSMEEGSFYESLVMMKGLALSVVVIIENNEWSLGTHITERRTPIDLSKLAGSVGIEYLKLEGNHTGEYLDILKSIRNKALETCEPVCIEVILKTLGDRRNAPTPEYPEGKYINYHAGPSPTVNVQEVYFGSILRENADDPLFVLREEIGNEKFDRLAGSILAELKDELI